MNLGGGYQEKYDSAFT